MEGREWLREEDGDNNGTSAIRKRTHQTESIENKNDIFTVRMILANNNNGV